MNENERFHLLMKQKGWDYSDIARITGLTYGSVKNALAPSRKDIPPWLKISLKIWWEQNQ